MIVVMPNGHPNQAAAADVFSPPDPSLLPFPRASQSVLDAHITEISDSLVTDVVPFVEKNFRVKPSRENRAVAGLSMGGGQALYVGLNHLDQFAWIASFSGAFILWPGGMVQPLPSQTSSDPNLRTFQPSLNLQAVPKNFPNLNAKDNPKIRLFYISCGTEDGLIKSNREFKGWLKSHGIQFVDVETPGYAHVWSYWRVSVLDLVPRLFTAAH
jgi:enterochelin esterase family protein